MIVDFTKTGYKEVGRLNCRYYFVNGSGSKYPAIRLEKKYLAISSDSTQHIDCAKLYLAAGALVPNERIGEPTAENNNLEGPLIALVRGLGGGSAVSD